MIMKKLILVIILVFGYQSLLLQGQADYSAYVNPLVGTDSRYDLSNGNTYPAIALPWGMNFWTPQTNEDNKNGWIYQYDADQLNGFRQTHQPSPWIRDYGAFALFPVTGEPQFDNEGRASWFSHKTETVRPNYYEVYLADHDTWVEITPTERAARFRITYPAAREAYLVIDGFENSYLHVLPGEKRIVGYTRQNSGGVPENFRNYFVIEADTEFEVHSLYANGKEKSGVTEVESGRSGAIIRFKTGDDNKVNLEVASSFISHEQAALNLEREIGSRGFDEIREAGKAAWNRELGRIAVEGGSDAQFTTFYTALYRTLLFPRKFFEFDRQGKIVHYSPYNGKIEDGYMFTDNGFWDTFRAVFPFFTLMYPDLNTKIMQGLANTYRESGWLPEWASPGHRDCMIGSNSAINIADAYLKGIPNPEIEILYEAILKNSKYQGPVSSVGRFGVDYYNELGYIPYDVGVKENTARTLEYAFADYNIWKLAEKLGRPQEEIDMFRERSMYYVNVFDTTVNFMRGKNEDGTFQSPFRADKWGDAFTEGCSWHWTWCVFHDPAGLMDLMGGKEPFVQKLDSVFVAAPTYDFSYYGFRIHEITEMLIAGMGQYAHGNQPIQHMPYLYNYAGVPWKTQAHVREIMDRLYTPLPDGLCGDEDNGQTSAWYVFSAMGMYPVAPGTGEYALGSPIFKKVTLKLENGNTFVIGAPFNSSENVYIRDAKLNGKRYTKNYLEHTAIMEGGELELRMSPRPNMERGTGEEDLPYSTSQ